MMSEVVDVGFVNQNSGFSNQRFDNQGSTTKVRQLKTAVSSTKVRQPKSRIRQPRGSSTKKVGFVNQNQYEISRSWMVDELEMVLYSLLY